MRVKRRSNISFAEGARLKAATLTMTMKSLQVLGIRSHGEKAGRRKVPPQFMVELYNNVADPSGVTRGKNPYNAKVVRSFIERGKGPPCNTTPSKSEILLKAGSFHTDTTVSRLYFFNVTGLEVNESVLEAELHLYRRRSPLKIMHPSILASPYYLVSRCTSVVICRLFKGIYLTLDKSVSSLG